MSFPLIALLAGAVAVVALVWWYRRMRTDDSFQSIVHKRKDTARISSRAELVDGANHIAVALTLDPQHIFYENDDMQADLDLAEIDEVEYASDLVTGQSHAGGVLRLRAHGRAIEFILDAASARSWPKFLPAHRVDEGGRVHAN